MMAEVPGALWEPADIHRYHPRPQGRLYPWSLIIIHCTDGHGDAHGTADMWAQAPKAGEVGTSAHFVIGQDGTVIQAVPLRFAAQHAHAANAYSIGIEHCARTPGELSKDDPGLPPSDAQYAASAKLVAYLCAAAGVIPSPQNIQGHAQADPATTHTECPTGCGWDWPRYLAQVTAEYLLLKPPAVV